MNEPQDILGISMPAPLKFPCLKDILFIHSLKYPYAEKNSKVQRTKWVINMSKLFRRWISEYGLRIAWCMQKARLQHLWVQHYCHQGFDPESLSGYVEVTPRVTSALLGIQIRVILGWGLFGWWRKKSSSLLNAVNNHTEEGIAIKQLYICAKILTYVVAFALSTFSLSDSLSQ